jgi:glutamyl-tRNA synthetase
VAFAALNRPENPYWRGFRRRLRRLVENRVYHVSVLAMSKTTRVRFAPSPTGFLHIGGARTALFNWLFARATGGKFLLRIEDTDTERSEERFTKDILESLKWLGMDWDEEPVFQSARFDRYRAIAQDLMAKGHAYRCECTPAELDAIREKCTKEKRPFRYPGTCRNKGLDRSDTVIRIKVPHSGETGFTDLIRGPISFKNADIDDWVIMRANQSPTYNFSVVVDDHDLDITHVLRGEDHINNTPKQILLYQTLGYAVPEFAHLPMILGPDRSKLSKRHGAASTLEYRAMGFLPIALINFLARLGWSHGDQEIFTLDELKKVFSVSHIGKANAVFGIEKLTWMGGKMMEIVPAAELYDYLHQYFPEQIPFLSGLSRATVESGIGIIQGKVKNVLDLIEQLGCLFGEDPVFSKAALKESEVATVRELLAGAIGHLEASSFVKEDLETRLRAFATEKGIKLTPIAQAVRFGVTGGKVSPGLFEMLALQGKDRVLRRVRAATKALQE